MVITKREDVTKQGFCNTPSSGKSVIRVRVRVRWGGRLFEAGRFLTFSAFRMGAYSRWALFRSWALIRINTVCVVYTKVPSTRILTFSKSHFNERDSCGRFFIRVKKSDFKSIRSLTE